ncbi:kinase-like protein [Athelia psychrophila]|uniref:Kinase-like protein n=1 Tax=Athelia psychrophila TaxID=1759441 RepID=A0A167UNY9_9AGAM|nr:kinase-like protein [Fibularhizoctonia sp. CBS 109695]
MHQKAQEPLPGCFSASSMATPDCCSCTVSPRTPTPRPTICQVLQAYLTRVIQPLDLTGQIAYGTPTIFGGHADVSRGIWRVHRNQPSVAVKVIRSPAASSTEYELKRYDKRRRREVQVWKRLRHQNIVHLLGTATDFPCRMLQGSPRPVALVSPWMERGNLKDLLSRGSIYSISDLLQLLCGVAEGLNYLHCKSVIHADLHPGNILIHDDGHPCLTDFGQSSINAEFAGTSYFSTTMCAAIRWCAPELIPPQGGVIGFIPRLTSACDIFSFGNVMLQVLSNKLPYYNIERDSYVLISMRNQRPERPPRLSDVHWEFIQSCWGFTPSSRPTAGMVHQSLLTLCNK